MLRDNGFSLIIPFSGEPNRDIPIETFWCQQNVAFPPFDINVSDYFHEIFVGHWIGRHVTIQWPPRSPDLTPLEYSV